MKVAILCPTFPRTKTDYWLPLMNYICPELAKHHDLKIVCSAGPGTKNYEERDGFKIYRFKYFFDKYQALTYKTGIWPEIKKSWFARLQLPFFMISFLIKTLKVCRDVDVIHAYTTLAVLVAWLPKIIYKVPLIMMPLGTDIRTIPKFINQFAFNQCNCIVCASPEWYDLLVHKYHRTRNIVDIKEAFCSDDFIKKVDKQKLVDLKKEFGIKKEFVVTYLCRLIDIRDPLTFVKAIPLVLRKTKNVKFLIVGGGDLLDETKKLVKELNIEDHTVVTGFRSDVSAIFEISDFFVMTSVVENVFNIAIFEAMTKKAICVLTDVGYTSRAFIHNKDVFLFKSRDPQALADSLCYLMENPVLRNKLSNRGPEYLKEFGWTKEVLISQTNSMYEQLKKDPNCEVRV